MEKEFLVDSKMTVHEILSVNHMEAYEHFLFFRSDHCYHDDEGCTVEDLHKKIPTWQTESMLYGLKRLYRDTQSGRTDIIPVYSKTAIKEEFTRKEVCIIPFLGDPCRPSVILCAGGGYQAVCSMAESIPAAARFQDLGYNAFVLNYRVSDAAGDSLMPKPLEDLAQCVRFLNKYRVSKNMADNRYAVCGFSAGGNLVAEFARADIGYHVYRVQKPDAVFCIYGAVEFFKDHFDNYFCQIVFGNNYNISDLKKYNVPEHIDEDYPDTYLAACRDDDVVPYVQTIDFEKALKQHGVRYETDLFCSGGHGFGDGYGTEAQNWIRNAADFWNVKKHESKEYC